MAEFSGTIRATSSVIVPGPLFEVRSQLTTKPRIYKITATLASVATGSVTLGVGRSAAVGVTPLDARVMTTTIDGSTGPAQSRTQLCSQWLLPPTVPTNFMRRGTLAGTPGFGVLWTFPRGLGLAPSGSVIGVLISGGANVDAEIVIDE